MTLDRLQCNEQSPFHTHLSSPTTLTPHKSESYLGVSLGLLGISFRSILSGTQNERQRVYEWVCHVSLSLSVSWL